jgi:hypothetical protein
MVPPGQLTKIRLADLPVKHPQLQNNADQQGCQRDHNSDNGNPIGGGHGSLL